MQSGQPPLQLIAWFIWFAILNGLVVIQFIIGGGIPSSINEGVPPALLQYLPALPAFLALAVRFLIIPRISSPQKIVPVMVIGLALAETTGLLGILLVDKAYGGTRLTFFILSLLAILLMAPVYLKKKSEHNPFTH